MCNRIELLEKYFHLLKSLETTNTWSILSAFSVSNEYLRQWNANCWVFGDLPFKKPEWNKIVALNLLNYKYEMNFNSRHSHTKWNRSKISAEFQKTLQVLKKLLWIFCLLNFMSLCWSSLRLFENFVFYCGSV